MPSAEKPASFAKCRRENFPNIDFLHCLGRLPRLAFHYGSN
jgi:hypothetical protein